MASQREIMQGLDSLLVLAGETEEHSRTNHAYSVYSASFSSRHTPLYILLSGSHSGFAKLTGKPQAEIMKDYLQFLGVPEEIMHTQTKSLDTLGDMVFSQPILDEILSGYITKRVGLVTDNFHMDRSLWLAKRVFGRKYDVLPLPAERNTTLFGRMIEKFMKSALQIDLRIAGIEAGNQEAFEKYLQERHPFYSENPRIGVMSICFGTIRRLLKNILSEKYYLNQASA